MADAKVWRSKKEKEKMEDGRWKMIPLRVIIKRKGNYGVLTTRNPMLTVMTSGVPP